VNKLISKVLLGAELAVLGLYFAYAYGQGYSGNAYRSSALVVYGILVFLGLSLLTLLWFAAASFFRKRQRVWHTFSLLLFLGIIFLFQWLPSPEIAWVYGVKHRVQHDFTPEELRQFAKDVTKARVVREGGGDVAGWDTYPSASRAPLSETQKLTISQLRKSYSFLSNPDNGPSVLTYPNEVTLQWGPADEEGIWCGCSITLDGQERKGVDPRLTVMPISKDIIFYYALPD
jgi:ABC-type transport system involved in multi-copper enzyme maturation permease subunit